MRYQNALIRLVASLIISLWMATSAFAVKPWETITEQKGSYLEHVVGIKINEDSKQPLDNDKLVYSFAKAVSKADKALIEKRARELYWSTFSETFGIGATISTFAENAMEIGSLENINKIATKLCRVIPSGTMAGKAYKLPVLAYFVSIIPSTSLVLKHG